MPRPICPPIAADVIAEIGSNIVLIERRNFPFGWALPGGFVDVGEKVEDAAVRELREETTLEVELRALLGVYSRPDRDPRGHTVSVVYFCRPLGGELRGGDDAADARWFSAAEAASLSFAFDHAEIVGAHLSVA